MFNGWLLAAESAFLFSSHIRKNEIVLIHNDIFLTVDLADIALVLMA